MFGDDLATFTGFRRCCWSRRAGSVRGSPPARRRPARSGTTPPPHSRSNRICNGSLRSHLDQQNEFQFFRECAVSVLLPLHCVYPNRLLIVKNIKNIFLSWPFISELRQTPHSGPVLAFGDLCFADSPRIPGTGEARLCSSNRRVGSKECVVQQRCKDRSDTRTQPVHLKTDEVPIAANWNPREAGQSLQFLSSVWKCLLLVLNFDLLARDLAMFARLTGCADFCFGVRGGGGASLFDTKCTQ